jgi:recombination protein RecA
VATPRVEKPKKTPAEQQKPAGVNIYHELAAHLSTVTGIWDPKAKDADGKPKLLLPPAVVMVGGNEHGEPTVRIPGVVSTRCETLDAAIGVGGFPMSRISVLAGGEGSGKTTIAGLGCAEIQSLGGVPLYIDNEHKLDLDYFATIGVDLSKFLFTQPSTLEDSFVILNELILKVLRDHPGKPIFGVVDSLNATKSSKEYEEDGTADFTGSNQGGLGASARFMSINLPKLVRLISQKPVALLFISQPRDNIGTPGRNLVAGGNAPKFYAALGIEVFRKSGDWEESGRKVGGITIAKIFKNQVSKPNKELIEIPMRFGLGVDYHKSLLDQATKMALVESSGSWYSMPSDDPKNPIKWQSMKGWHKLITERPEILHYLRDQVRAPYASKVMSK